MTIDLKLENGKLLIGDQLIPAEIGIDDGSIVKVSRIVHEHADERVDLKGNIVLPGLVDVHVHLRDFKLSYKETFETGTMALAAGGVTCAVDMPNTLPPVNSYRILVKRIDEAKGKLYVNVLFTAFPSKRDILKLVTLTYFFKIDFSRTNFLDFNPYNERELSEVLSKVSSETIVVAFHAEDTRKTGGSWPMKASAETSAVKYILNWLVKFMNQYDGALKAHICHVTLPSTVKLILESKRKLKNLTMEVAPHHLLLSKRHLGKFKSIAKVTPPLRSSHTRRRLLRYFSEGLIDIVASDHAPHALTEKAENVIKAPPGIAGAETMLPLLLNLVNKGVINLSLVKRVLHDAPCKLLGLKHDICEGSRAHLTIVDMKARWKIRGEDLYSMSKLTPFEGVTVKGIPSITIVNGMIVMRDRVVYENVKPGEVINEWRRKGTVS